MFNSIDYFRLSGTNRGASNEAATGGDVNKDDRIVLRMDIFLHDVVLRFRRKGDTSIGWFCCMSSIPDKNTEVVK